MNSPMAQIRNAWMPTAVILLLLVWSGQLHAQGSASITVDRNPVVAGQPFRITFEFKDARVNFQSPPAIDGLRYINGPSTSNSTQILNGAMSSTRGFTYTAVAGQPGVLRIPAQTFKSGKATLRTAPIQLRVAKPGDGSTTAPAQFEAVIEVDKKQVHLGEPVRVQYRIFNRLDGVDVRNYEFPDLSGAWKETVEGEDPRWENTVINGQRFQFATLRTDILYPTQTGTLTLEGFNVDGQARISFFNTRPLSSSARTVNIEVLPLPGTPPAPSLGTFSGLTMRWTMDQKGTPKVNEAVNLALEFSGRGNLGLIQTPDLDWPADLEVFDPDIQDRIRTTVDGQRGKRTLTWLVIPRSEGQFEVALPELSYFDYDKDRFIRLSAPAIALDVEGGEAGSGPSFGFNSKSDVTILTRDVRFIHTETALRPRERPFFGGPIHMALWGLPPFALLGLFALKRRRDEASKDPRIGRRKEAQRALKAALGDAQAGKLDLDALGQALHGFLQSQLDIPRSDAGRERYAQALESEFGMDTARLWLDLVDVLDRGRFAPGAPEAGDVAARIEASLKTLDSPRPSAASRQASVGLLLLMAGSSLAWAAPDPSAALDAFQAGNAAYSSGDYEAAIDAYGQAAAEWTSFELEYNLGGAHYKAGQIGPSILHYERARKIRPNDDDLNANLLLAQAAVTDRIEEMPDIGFGTLWRELISQERLAGWTAASLILWWLAWSLLAFRWTRKDVATRRVLSIAVPALLLLALGVGELSRLTHQRIVAEDGAVIMAPRVEVMSGPASASGPSKLFVLHEGTVVQLLREEGDWRQIQLGNGNTGWLPVSAMEGI